MKNRVVLILMAFCILICNTGCQSRHEYGQTATAIVLIKEFENESLTKADIDGFMQSRYPDAQYASSDHDPTDDSPFIRSVWIGEGLDAGICYEYETEETAKREYSDNMNYIFQYAVFNGMNTLYVRIGRFIFGGGAHYWRPFLGSLGIACEEKEYTVADKDDVTKDQLDGWNYADIERVLKKAGYSSVQYTTGWMLFIDPDGTETYMICNDPETVAEIRSNNKLTDALPMFEYQIGTDSSFGGMSYYCAEDCIVFSRGNSITQTINGGLPHAN